MGHRNKVTSPGSHLFQWQIWEANQGLQSSARVTLCFIILPEFWLKEEAREVVGRGKRNKEKNGNSLHLG